MNRLNNNFSSLCLVSLAILAGCGKSDDDPSPAIKSTAKAITSFTFSSLGADGVATIAEATKSIRDTVPSGTVVTNLVPTIAISEKSTISPASGVAGNFSGPVKYTVTAEDGSTQDYTVTVVVRPRGEPVKSSDKAITVFTLARLTPPVAGTISEDTKTISLTVLKGTPVKALVPTFSISDKAGAVPSSGVAQDFTNPVKYTVTAEDNSKVEYTVTVTVSTTVTFTVSPLASLNVQQGGQLKLSGSGFGDFKNDRIILKSAANGEEREIKASAASLADQLVFDFPAGLPLGNYTVTVFVGTQDLLLNDPITVQPHAPKITEVNRLYVLENDTLVIEGNYFADTGNIVEFVGGSGIALEIIEESATKIWVKIPLLLDGKRDLRVTSHGMQTVYETKITYGTPPPVITTTDKASYNLGEAIIITGQNLRRDGFSTTVYFMPTTSGPMLQSVGKVNADGTQLTVLVPNSFPVGIYTISIDINGETSKEYQYPITIDP
jgi:hypothetical protein